MRADSSVGDSLLIWHLFLFNLCLHWFDQFIIHYNEQCGMETWLLSIAADRYLKYMYDKVPDSFIVNFYIKNPEDRLSEELR